MHPALKKLSDQQKIECYELALESCMHTLMCMPADQVLKTMIRRDLYALIEKRGGKADEPQNEAVLAAISLFS